MPFPEWVISIGDCAKLRVFEKTYAIKNNDLNRLFYTWMSSNSKRNNKKSFYFDKITIKRT